MRKQNFTNNQKNNRGIQNNNRDDGERNRNTKQNYNTNMNKKNYPNRGVNDFEDNTPNSHSTNSNYQEKPKKNYNKNANQERGPPRENNFGYNYQNNDGYKQGDYDYDSKFSQENQGRENNYSNYRGKNQQNKSSNYRGFENKKPYGNYGNHQADDYGDLRSKPNTFSKIPENNNMRYSVKDTFQENKGGNVNELVNEQETKISGKNLIDKFNNFKKPFNSVANKQLTSTPNENTITNTNPNYELNNNNNNNDNQNNNNNNNNQNNNNNNNNHENREYEEKGEDIPQSVINNRKKDVKQYDPSVEVIKIHPKNQSYQNQNKPNSIKPPYVSKPDNMNNRAPYQNQSNNRFTSNNNYNGRGRGQNKRQPYNDRNMIKSKPGKSNNDFSDSKDNESSEDYDQQNKGGYNQNSQNKFNQNQKGKFQNSHNIRNFQKNPHKQEKPVYQGKRKPNNDDDTSESEEISNNNKYQNKNKNPNQNFKQGNSHVQSQGKQGQVSYNNKNTGGGIKNSNPFFTNSMGKVSNNNYNNNNNNNKMHNKQKEPSSEEEENEEEEEEEEEEDSDNEDKNEGESKENSDSESEGKENNTGNKITNPQLGVNQMNMNPLSQGQFFNPNQNFIPQPMQIGVTDPNIIREKLQELGIHPSQINSIHPQVLNNLLYQAQLKSLGMNQNNPMLLQQQMQMQNVQTMQNQPKLNPQLQQVVPQMGGNYPLLINNNNFPGVMRYPQVQNPQMMGQQVRMNNMQPPMNFQQLNKGQFPLQQQTNNVNMNMNMMNQLNRQGNFNPLTNTNPNINQNVQLNNQQQGQLQGQGQGQGQLGNPNLMQNSNLNNFDKKEIKNETNLNNNNNNKNESTEKSEMNNLNSLNNPMLQQQNRFANQYPNPNLQGQQNFPYPNSTDPRLLGQNNNQINNQGQNNFMQPYPNSMIQNNQQNSNINNNNLNFGGKPDLTPKQHEKSKDVNESSNFSDAEDESLTNLKNKHLGGLGKDKHDDDKAKDDLIEISNLTSDKNSEEKEDSNNELEEVSANLNNNTGTGMNTNNVFNQGMQQNTTPGVGLNQLNPQMQLQGNFQQIPNSIQQQNSNNTIMPHLKPEIIKFLHPQQINQLNQLFQLNPLMYNQHMNKLLLLLGINPEIISQQSQPQSQQVNPNLAQQQFENNFKNMSSSVDPMNNQVKSQQNNLNQFNQVSQVQMQSKQDNKSDNTSSIKETGQSFNQGNPYQQMQQNSNLNTNLNQQPNINIPSNSNLSNSSVMNTNISNPELSFPQQQQFNTNQPFPKQQIPIGNNVIVQQDPRLLPNMYQPRPYGNNYNNNIIILGNNLNNVIPSLVSQTNQINTPQTNDRGDLNLNSNNSSHQNNFSNNMNRFPNTNTLTGTGTGVGNVGNNVQFNPLENERVSQNNSKTQVIPSNFNNNPIPNFKNLSLTPNQQMFQGQINPNFGLQGQGQGQGQNNPMIKQNPNLMHNPYGLQQNYNQNLMSSNISDIEKTNQNNFASEVEEDNEQKEKQDVEADEDSDSLSLENKEYKLPKNENFSSLPQRFQQAQYNLLNQQNLFAFNNNLNDPNSLFKELNKNSINPNLQAVCDNERDFNQNLLNNTNTQSQTQQVTYPRSKLDPNAKECIPKSRIVNLKD